MAGSGGKRPAARSRLVGGLPCPCARFAHDSNMGSTNVTDGMGPRQYIFLYTYVWDTPHVYEARVPPREITRRRPPFIIQPRAFPPACDTRCQDAGG